MRGISLGISGLAEFSFDWKISCQSHTKQLYLYLLSKYMWQPGIIRRSNYVSWMSQSKDDSLGLWLQVRQSPAETARICETCS